MIQFPLRLLFAVFAVFAFNSLLQTSISKQLSQRLNTNIEAIASEVLNCAFRVHSKLGPGLLESAYEVCHSYELTKAGLRSFRQVPQPIIYDSLQLDEGYRLDLLIEDSIIIEIKAVESLAPVHHLQLKTYLKLSGKTLGFLINFNVPLLKQGLHRIVLNHPDPPKQD